MTKELIYRLRKGYQGIALGSDDMGWVFDLDTINEAADAIEAMQARCAELESQMQGLSNEINDFQNTIERQKREIDLLQKEQDTPVAFYDIGHDEDGDVEYEFCVYPRPGFRPLYAQARGKPVPPVREPLRVEVLQEIVCGMRIRAINNTTIKSSTLEMFADEIEAAIKEQAKSHSKPKAMHTT